MGHLVYHYILQWVTKKESPTPFYIFQKTEGQVYGKCYSSSVYSEPDDERFLVTDTEKVAM